MGWVQEHYRGGQTTTRLHYVTYYVTYYVRMLCTALCFASTALTAIFPGQVRCGEVRKEWLGTVAALQGTSRLPGAPRPGPLALPLLTPQVCNAALAQGRQPEEEHLQHLAQELSVDVLLVRMGRRGGQAAPCSPAGVTLPCTCCSVRGHSLPAVPTSGPPPPHRSTACWTP